jgi:hypothetical protein
MTPVKPGESASDRDILSTIQPESWLTMVHTVIEYSGHNYREVLQMPCDLFFLMKRNATIEALSQTEKGNEYLNDCKRLQATKPDYEAIKKRSEYIAEEVVANDGH